MTSRRRGRQSRGWKDDSAPVTIATAAPGANYHSAGNAIFQLYNLTIHKIPDSVGNYAHLCVVANTK